MGGAVAAMSLVVNAAMAQQAGAVKPQEKFKGPVKVFIPAEAMKPLLQTKP